MRMNKAALLVFTFGLMYAACALARQEQDKATLSGTIADSSGAAVPRVEIYLKNIDCECSKCKHDCDCCPDQHTTSDDAGDFSLSLGHGRYKASFKKPGFHTVTIDVDLRTDSTKNVTVTMQP